jgi:hypothetical protein
MARSNPTLRQATDWFTTSLAAATTIGARLPLLWSAALTGSPGAVQESQRMVSEKTQAALQGATAAGLAASRLWLQALTSMSFPSPQAWARVSQAALAPAHRVCRANARRLGPRRRRHRAQQDSNL